MVIAAMKLKDAYSLEHLTPLTHLTSKEQGSFNLMAAITICSDFGAQKIKYDTVFIVSPSVLHEVMGPDAMTLVF